MKSKLVSDTKIKSEFNTGHEENEKKVHTRSIQTSPTDLRYHASQHEPPFQGRLRAAKRAS